MKSTNGVERALSQRLSLLADSGQYEVYLITYNQYGDPFSFPVSDKVHQIDLSTRYLNNCFCSGLLQYFDRFFSKIVYKRAVQNCIKRIMPDVITCVDIHLVDLVTIINLNVDTVKIVECHCGLSAYFGDLEKYQSKRNKMLKQKEKIVRTIRKFDKVIVMTEAEKTDWNLGDKVMCIPNMLVSYPKSISNIDICHHRVISVGRYAFQKGYDMLLDAWKVVQVKHSNWSLHIYGSHDGDKGDYELLKEKIDIFRLCSVFLHPATSDVYSEYLRSDIFVMSSRYESFGLVLPEAMSCGLPVIAFDCPYGPADIIEDGKDGFLVGKRDSKVFARQICFLIENVDFRKCMGERPDDTGAGKGC